MLHVYKFIFAASLLIIINSNKLFGQKTLELTNDLISTVKSIKYLKYTCESNERVNGKLKFESSNFKICTSPYKIYVYQNQPKKGIECLYITGKNGGKARVNPNAMPWITLNLNPENTLMLENRHHFIYDAGFEYTVSLIEKLLKKYNSQAEKNLSYLGETKINGIPCHHLILNNPNYKLTLYTTTSNDETVISISRKLNINFYSILENNIDTKISQTFKIGTRLIVPNDYSSKMELYIHKEKNYPVYIKVFDSKGLYEEFKFLNVEINPTIKDIEFSELNPEYNFK